MTTATTDLAAGSTTTTAAPTNATVDQLRLFVERIERLEEEKKGMADDIKDVYLEAKAMGFDTKGMKSVVQLRKMEKDARDEMDAIVETYRSALGML